MRRLCVLLLATALVLGFVGTAAALDGPLAAGKTVNSVSIATIVEGEVCYSSTHYLAGEVIPLGVDGYGYNYQAHLFVGSYANAYLGGYGYPPYTGDDETYLAENPTAKALWVWPYRDVHLVMEWNDAWLANYDADGDGLLDRHPGFDSYIGSGAWLTNRMELGYTCKIVAAPADATLVGGVWYTAGGDEIGPAIWGAFAIIKEHDPYYDVDYFSDVYSEFAGKSFGPQQ